MADLLSRLQTAVGDTYRIEEELGGGGMSRVFLAEETRLDRKVVIKLLPPEMGAGVNVERFEREIKLAAKLQHPHIVPLLTAGSEGDLLWYVMPYIEGESLRAKLAREGELPIGDVVRILKEVLDALQYAHSHKVVHRDIKPDNVLLSGDHAVVTDFGVAKAVSASTGESSLTSLGVALGTPAYMSPEQAAADPHVDHRADIYAVGAMAYEMLCGRPPFIGTNAQQVLAAQVTNEPDPVTTHRGTVPPALNELILRCLHKKPADRFQRAEEIVPHLDALLTPSGGLTPTGTQPVQAVDYEARAKQAHPVRVAALFGLASIGALAIVYFLMLQLGLPTWVLYGAITLLVIGLPIMLLTGHRERQRAVATMTGMQMATPTGVQRHLTWRKSRMAGALGFGGLAVAAAGYMAMRALGIGPAGTLMTTGVLEQQERVILADFENRTADSTLGETVTELFRIDLSQSPALVVLEPSQIDRILRRMEHQPGTHLSARLAQDAAEREGIKAYVTGDVVSVGSGFVVSGRMIEAASGDALVSHREQAASADEIVDAVDRLSAKLRERIGESLRTVRADPPLERVTTSSMEALRLYAQAILVGDATAEYDRASQLLEQAVELDSTFAMAYRKMAVYSINAARPEQGDTAATRAYELRTQVGDRERWLIEGLYHAYVSQDEEAEENAYLSLLDKYPNDPIALNNQAINYRVKGRRSEAADFLLRSVRNGGAAGVSYTALLGDLGNLGRLDEAGEVLDKFKTDFPTHPQLGGHEVRYLYNRGDVDAAEQRAIEWLDEAAGNPQFAADPFEYLASFASLRGRVDESLRRGRDAARLQIDWLGDRIPAVIRENMEENLAAMLRVVDLDARLWYGTSPQVTAELVETEAQSVRELLLRQRLPDSLFPTGQFLTMFARLGEADHAQGMLSEMQRRDAESEEPIEAWHWKDEEALIAMARGHGADAARLYREFRDASPTCDLPTCLLFEIGMAFDSAGMSDSTLVYFERYLTEPAWSRVNTDDRKKPVVLRRLGELYEASGDRERALDYYGKLVELWADADPGLQPLVEDVRGRIARLIGENR